MAARFREPPALLSSPPICSAGGSRAETAAIPSCAVPPLSRKATSQTLAGQEPCAPMQRTIHGLLPSTSPAERAGLPFNMLVDIAGIALLMVGFGVLAFLVYLPFWLAARKRSGRHAREQDEAYRRIPPLNQEWPTSPRPRPAHPEDDSPSPGGR